MEHDAIRGAAFPFCQGVEGKPEWSGQDSLFDSALENNLPLEEWQYLMWWLKQRQLIEHNGQFDSVMTQGGPMEYRWGAGHGVDLTDNCVWDTMIGNHLLWPREPMGLKPTAERLWGVKTRDAEAAVKKWMKKNGHKLAKGIRYDLVPWSIMRIYATDDATLTLGLFLEQLKEFDQESFEWEYFRGTLLPVMRQLVRMEDRGLPYHVKASHEASKMIEPAKQRIAAELPFKATGDDAKVFFFSEKETAKGVTGINLEPIKRSEKTNEPSLDVDVLRELTEQEIPYAKDWQLYTLLDRAQSMYYDGWADKTGPDNRMRPRIKQFGTISSRFSIEYMNLQAMPKDSRLEGMRAAGLEGIPTPRQLIVRQVEEEMPDWVLVEFDLSQAELRLGALLGSITAMQAEYERERVPGVEADLHTLTSQSINSPRQVGKMANFLLLYGGGWDMMQGQIEKMTGGTVKLSAREASEIHRDYHRAYPEIARAVKKWEGYVMRKGYVPLVGGAKSYFRPGEEAHKGWNRRVQGTIAQFFLRWLPEVEEICSQFGVHELAQEARIGGAGPLMCVHDSVVCLLPRSIARQVSRRVAQQGQELWNDFFLDGIPGKIDAGLFKG